MQTPHRVNDEHLAAVQAAYQTVTELASWCPGEVKVCACAEDGRVFVRQVFHDLRQARLFAIQMRGLGYQEVRGPGAASLGCDVAFAPGAPPLAASARCRPGTATSAASPL